MIIFISCTKKKKDHKCTAREMYSASAWFRGAYSYAITLNPSKIYILSAKYGLLEPTDVIEPYEKSLITEKDKEIRNWSRMVFAQMEKKQINKGEEAIFICGKNYRKYLRNYFTKSSAPFEHMAIGQQLSFFNKKVR